MASEPGGKRGQTSASVLHSLKIFSLNLWRRLLMLWHYTVICLHQQRLRRAWRILGQRVHQALEAGEVNPLLTGEVKDSLAKAQAVKAAKDRQYEAVAGLREKIRASKAEAPPAPKEAEPAPAGESEPEPEPAPAPESEAEAAKESEPGQPQS